ncbi:hypothetical protein LTS07_011361 [Exophiala sideris]|nr:hypothetical protein LTS07_011361 [Exophiala sideris]KAK5022988.1 hypothetical protein LTR13_011373 [Exophiala sideris]KAK5176045.1 hypothetical protein LTR44_011404 [Eurotiomycetes sp. CCFEE 6388]
MCALFEYVSAPHRSRYIASTHAAGVLAGNDQYCSSGKLNQGFDCDGFYAEYVIVSPKNTVQIPDNLPLEKFGLRFLEFMTFKKLDSPARGLVGVFGLGGVGTFVVRFAIAMGFQVIGYDVSEAARKTAIARGALEAIDSSHIEHVKTETRRITGGRGLDGAIVAAGVAPAYAAAVEAIGFSKQVS